MENVDKVIVILKDLLSNLQNCTSKYNLASASEEYISIKESLLIYSRERSFYQLQLQHEIENLVKRANLDPEESLTKKSSDNLEEVFSLQLFFPACIEAEEKLIQNYKLALHEIKLDAALSLLLQNQLEGIEKSLIQIRYQQSLNLQ
ncbi:hypothetical protein [Flavobacterium aquicola]|uniref:DUF2383 domain-containing protein n=1 Tax=Flavobacterium aquicola TaxID=1682742 RepID=A0A3E0ECW9_9FLAO|nr:hypothetical protein [Flavobacterium aquicola]REG96091.1 hypothetical protein C8P67_11163 [Flavobacterium aquicola]